MTPGTPSNLKIDEAALAAMTELFGHTFSNPALVAHALTHSSAKSDDRPCNERLEFLGDAVLGLIVTEFIYLDYPEYPEGELTRVKSVLVSREMLAEKAQKMKLNEHVVIGKGVGSREDLPRSILANIFEALLAALYLDGGYGVCQRFLRECFRDDVLPIITHQITRNYKSALQQLGQSRLNCTPSYKLLSESGPDHDKRFCVAAVVDSRQFASGEGSSKKEAEQTAAHVALKTLLMEIDLGDENSSLLLELADEEDEEV